MHIHTPPLLFTISTGDIKQDLLVTATRKPFLVDWFWQMAADHTAWSCTASVQSVMSKVIVEQVSPAQRHSTCWSLPITQALATVIVGWQPPPQPQPPPTAEVLSVATAVSVAPAPVPSRTVVFRNLSHKVTPRMSWRDLIIRSVLPSSSHVSTHSTSQHHSVRQTSLRFKGSSVLALEVASEHLRSPHLVPVLSSFTATAFPLYNVVLPRCLRRRQLSLFYSMAFNG